MDSPARFCPQCGTDFGPGAAFCRRCGRPRAAGGPPALAVPGARGKLSPFAVVLFSGLILVFLVVALSVAAVESRPTVNYCPFSCLSQVGPRLLGETAYHSTQFGYRVEYAPVFTLTQQSPSGMELFGNDDNFMKFSAIAGDDVQGAIQEAVNGLDTAEVQDLRVISAVVPGAEIGYVPGTGEAFSANFATPGFTSSTPVSVVVMAAAHRGLTISVVVVGSQDLSTYVDLPLGLQYGEAFDFEVSNTVWPGDA